MATDNPTVLYGVPPVSGKTHGDSLFDPVATPWQQDQPSGVYVYAIPPQEPYYPSTSTDRITIPSIGLSLDADEMRQILKEEISKADNEKVLIKTIKHLVKRNEELEAELERIKQQVAETVGTFDWPRTVFERLARVFVPLIHRL